MALLSGVRWWYLLGVLVGATVLLAAVVCSGGEWLCYLVVGSALCVFLYVCMYVCMCVCVLTRSLFESTNDCESGL